MRYALIAAFMIFLVPISAYAEDENTLRLPPPGHTILNLSATETQKVAQDTIVASLRIEADEAESQAAQDVINTAMQKAVAIAKKDSDLKVTTGGYSVYPYDPDPNQPRSGYVAGEKRKQRWKGMQTIDIQSKTAPRVLDIARQLQELGFVMNNLGYTLSTEKYESVQDEMLGRALAKLDTKAQLAAKSLKKSGYEMLDVNLNPSGYVMPMMARSEMMLMKGAMADSVATPVAEAGESDVSLTVSARVMLKP